MTPRSKANCTACTQNSMMYCNLLWLWILLGYISSTATESDSSCRDERGSYCRRLAQKQLLSRCYTRESRCCATCRRLRLDIPGCPYGDRASWCGSIGYERPISDCYTHNVTCCQTCSLYHSGNSDCPYGDQLNWCSEIGSRYLVSSCYEKERSCCDTCSRFKKQIPGCEYGDHENWCPWIALSYCYTDPHVCCATCSAFLSTTTTATTTTTMTTTTTTTTITTSISSTSHKGRATTAMLSSKTGPEVVGIATYTGSPGRPGDGGGVMTSRHVNANAESTTHSSEHSPTVAPPAGPTDLGGGGQLDSSLAILCFNNSTRHKLRHDKHGGRHRSRDGLGSVFIVCKNATANEKPFVNFNNSEQVDLTLRSNSSISHKTSPHPDEVSFSNNLTTASPGATGIHGDKEYQEGHGLVFSKSPERHTITRIHLSLGFLILLFQLV